MEGSENTLRRRRPKRAALATAENPDAKRAGASGRANKKLRAANSPDSPEPSSYPCSAEGRASGAKQGRLRHRCGRKIYYCSHEGCTNQARAGGVCLRHGGKVYYCSHEGCGKQVQNGGVCNLHGAARYICSHEGCTNLCVRGGVCFRHGAAKKACKHDGCNNHALKGGLCYKHGAKFLLPTCRHEGCAQLSYRKGFCKSHAPRRVCSHPHCTNRAIARGKCRKHDTEYPKKKREPCNCNYPGCNYLAIARGKCRKHDEGYTVKVKKSVPCDYPGCKNKAKARGKCRKHDTEYSKKKSEPCNYLGCNNQAIARGKCRKHDEGYIVKKSVSWGYPGYKNKEKAGVKYPKHDSGGEGRKRCIFEGCKRYVTLKGGLCWAHGSPIDCNDPGCTNKAVARGMCSGQDRECRLNDADGAIGDDILGLPPTCLPVSNDEKSDELSASDFSSDDGEISDAVDDSTSYTNQGSTTRPAREVLTWIRQVMSDGEKRQHVDAGLRVKVRFEDGVWYGGTIASVIDRGQRVQIRYDDGTEEVSDFPENDIIVDDQNNGRHRVDALAFLHPCFLSGSKGEGGEIGVQEEGSNKEDSSPADNFVARAASDAIGNIVTSHAAVQSNPQDDSDEEELGAFIYRSSRAAKALALAQAKRE